MATLNYLSKTSTSISLSISNLSYPSTSYSFPMTHNGSEWQYIPTNGSSTTVYGTYSGLSPSTSYTIDVYATYTPTGITYYQGSITQTTDAPPLSTPSFVSASVTSTTLTVTYSTVSGATYYDMDLSNGSYVSGLTSPSYTFINLTPSTQYGVMCRARNASTSSPYSSYTYRTTLANTRPSNWAWASTVSAGSNINISASDWNNFTTRINGFRVYKNIALYTFTTAFSGNEITASIVNQARTAISAMNPTTSVPSTVSSGSVVTAYTFTRLRDSLNSIT